MLETKVTELFKIKYPIIQGGLQGLGTSQLVSAVSEAGALGLITAGSYENKQAMLADIENVRKKTDQPFGINMAIGIRRPMEEFVEGAIEAQVPIVFTSGSNPEPFMDQLKGAGIKVVHVVPSIRFAKKAEKIGCDAVVVVGFECGGHPGLEDTTSLVLTSKAVDELSIPIIAAGGFYNGKGLLAALSLGAEAIQMGTRFLLTKENPLNENVKRKMLGLSENDTDIIKRSIRKPARVMKTEVTDHVLKLEKEGTSIEELLPYIGGESYQKLINGDLSQGVISLGQSIGGVTHIPSVSDLIDQIMCEANEQLNRMINRFLYH